MQRIRLVSVPPFDEISITINATTSMKKNRREEINDPTSVSYLRSVREPINWPVSSDKGVKKKLKQMLILYLIRIPRPNAVPTRLPAIEHRYRCYHSRPSSGYESVVRLRSNSTDLRFDWVRNGAWERGDREREEGRMR